MPKRSFIETLPDNLRILLIAKLLAREPYQGISQWVLQEHGLTLSKSLLHSAGKPLQDTFAPLLALGMPTEEIAKNYRKIEEIGIGQIRQTLIDRLTGKSGEIFAYFDKQEAEQ